MSTVIALLILQHLHGHPIKGYENPQNEYSYSTTHSSIFTWSPYNRHMKTHRMSTGIALLILQHIYGQPITGYKNPKNEYRYNATHSSPFTWSPYKRL